jgi:hypothetical protein
MPGEFHQKDFVQSLFYQDLEVTPELYDFVSSYKIDPIDHVETSFYESELNVELIRLTMECVEPFFIEAGKKLGKSGLQVLKMWIQRYGQAAYHPIHVHGLSQFEYSFAFYVDCTETSGHTMFYNVGYPYVDHTNFKVQPKIGRCVLFPGSMPHEAMPNRDERRMIVSGNIVYFEKQKLAGNPNINLGVAGLK